MNESIKGQIKVFLKNYKEGKRTKSNLINGIRLQQRFWEVYHPKDPLPDSVIAGFVVLRILKDKPNRWTEPKNEMWKKGVFENEDDIKKV